MVEPQAATNPDGPPAKVAVAAWYTVAVLLLFYILSTIDRTIINMMVQPLERDLHITDLQISLLQGPAFGLLYAIMGIPSGWLIDRVSRRGVAAAGIALWGLATCYCGVAGGIVQLALGRAGVGIGESVLTPAAHSLISDQFPRRWLARAISVYTLGSVIGSGLALALGGAVVHLVTHTPPVHLPGFGLVRAWQLAFLIVGAPTVILMPLIMTIRERHADTVARAAPAPAGGGLSFVRRHWRVAVGLPLAFGLTNILCSAGTSWIPTLMIRRFGWNPAEVGLAFGSVMLFGGVVGQLSAAVIVDTLYARGVKDAHIRYHMAGLLLTIPCAVLAFQASNPFVLLALLAVFFTITYPFVGYAAAALQLFAPQRERGRVSAIFLAIVTVVGLAFGPTVPALLTDYVFHDKAKLGLSLSVVYVVIAPLILLAMSGVAKALRDLHANPPAAA